MTFERDSEGGYGVCLTVAYDGTAFSGWQVQPDRRTVQSELSAVVHTMSGCTTTLRGCSRTDAGVHAEGQVVAFRAVKDISMDGWLRGMNTRLSPDVVVIRAVPCPVNYDPRFDAIEKAYRYVIDTGVVRSPRLRNTSWHMTRARAHPDFRRLPVDDATKLLDVAAMREAASRLEGTHDFRAFRASDDERESSERTLHEVSIETPFMGEARLLAIHVRGTAFLQHMVRIITGTLLDVGRGMMTSEQVKAELGPQGDRKRTGETAPAQGLTLLRITTRLSLR